MSDETLQPANTPQRAKEPLSVVRIIVAAIGILVMVVTGGCTILVGIPTVMYGDFSGFPLLLIFGGIPFAIGYLIFWLGAKWNR